MSTGRVPTTANSPLTAKGDLFGYSTTQARVPVGSDGETLVADSSASTGLRWQSNFAAGKNKIINGDFGIWQRGTSFTTTDSYTADRWYNSSNLASGGTNTVSRETFTAGTAPVSGYEGQYYLRIARTSSASNSTVLQQRIEDVRTFAGQTVTFSYWAKVSSGTATNDPNYILNYGSGGSTQSETSMGSTATITTSWQRFSHTFTLPSVSGKTIGAGSYFAPMVLRIITSTSVTVDIWGVQLEAGNTATAFQTATGTLAGELAAAMRYYQRFSADGGAGNSYGVMAFGMGANSTTVAFAKPLLVRMRTSPSSLEYSNLRLQDTAAAYTITNLVLSNGNTSDVANVSATSSSITTYRPYFLDANNTNNAYIAFSAEL